MSNETKMKITVKICPNCGGNETHCTICWGTGKWYNWEKE